ncbi:Redoxin domain protein, partial [mine drainage metagenome]
FLRGSPDGVPLRQPRGSPRDRMVGSAQGGPCGVPIRRGLRYRGARCGRKGMRGRRPECHQPGSHGEGRSSSVSKSARRARPPRPSHAARQAAEAAARRRRRWGFGSAGAVILLVAAILGVHFASGSSGSASSASVAAPAAGSPAPNGTFATLAGQTTDVASLRGQPTLLWFVSTWCSSCQAGTQSMTQNLAALRSDGVHVTEVELYQDLGQSGPSMGSFAKALAGT